MTSQLFGKAAPSNEVEGPYESSLTPLITAQRGGFLKPCGFIVCFHDTCGHIETKTSCHNITDNILPRCMNDIINQKLVQAYSSRYYPCDRLSCDQSVVATICIQEECVQCKTRDDPTNPLRIQFDEDPTITRSDPNVDVIPAEQIETRRTYYHERMIATQARHRALSLHFDPHSLLFGDFSTEYFDRTARDFIEHHRKLQRHPGFVDSDEFYAVLREGRAEEDRTGIDLKKRQYYSGDKFDETDLMCLIKPTDARLVGENCPICQESFLSHARDPRSMPCGHMFHWACISEWFYKVNPSCPHCRRRYKVTTLPRFLPQSLDA
ncbi:hypothetical protein V493_07899 [Pseudogymnoascus sp. VKM F-4281 (FW-2241)]|nr:hypothetical protein V493_07899 [Pseudogymnoascus sp. VKM F-4281 (FW-2241)]